MELSLLVLATLGFFLTSYIWYKKAYKQKLVCAIGHDCEKVINSKYSKIFFIDNTVIGILYYLFMALSAIFSFSGLFITLRAIGSAGAALFSLYLTYIQLAVLKEWCEYCLASALISIAIFLVLVF